MSTHRGGYEQDLVAIRTGDSLQRWIDEASAAAVVQHTLDRFGIDLHLGQEIMSNVDRVIEESTPTERLYVTCVKVVDEWKSTASPKVGMVLAIVDDLQLYASYRYQYDMPNELYPGTPILRGFYWLVRKRIVEVMPTALAVRFDSGS